MEDTSDANDLSGEGCGGFAWTLMREPLAIAGSWASEFSEETITSQNWDSGFGVSAVRDWDNADQWVVTQNAADAEFGPNTFNAVLGAWRRRHDLPLHRQLWARDLGRCADERERAPGRHAA